MDTNCGRYWLSYSTNAWKAKTYQVNGRSRSTTITPKKGDREDLKNLPTHCTSPDYLQSLHQVIDQSNDPAAGRTTTTWTGRLPKWFLDYRSSPSCEPILRTNSRVQDSVVHDLRRLREGFRLHWDKCHRQCTDLGEYTEKIHSERFLNINANCSTSIRLYHNDIVIPINQRCATRWS